MADYYNVDFLRNLTSNFVDFQVAHSEWIRQIEKDDAGKSFKNLIKTNHDKDEETIIQCTESFRESGQNKKIADICSQSKIEVTSYGKIIGEVLEDLGLPSQNDWESLCRTYRNLDVQLLRHIPAFFNCSKTQKGSNMKSRFASWHYLIKLTPEQILEDYYNIVEILCRLKEPDIKKNIEQSKALGIRCLRLFKGVQTVAMISCADSLRAQLKVIQWQDYVHATATRNRESEEAIVYLRKFRTMKNTNVSQVFGPGGLGKTKLILEFLKECINPDNTEVDEFKAYLFLTAKSVDQGEFNSEVSEIRNGKSLNSPRDPTLAIGHYVPNMDFDETMDYMYSLVGLGERDRNKETLFDCFKSDKLLVILDNFEDTSEDSREKFNEFFDEFRELEGNKTKIIITGRSDIDENNDLWKIKLNKLDSEQATKLLKMRYEYQFQELYSTKKNSAIYSDFRKELNEEILDRLYAEVENQKGAKVADYARNGIHHPVIMFYFVSLIMDETIVEEFKDTTKREPTFMDIFLYVVCHDEYGIAEYLTEWDKWIQDKTTLLINNDKTCMDILEYMSREPNTFFDVVLLKLDIDRNEIERAFNKLIMHDNILDLHLDDGTYRISDSTMEYFDFGVEAVAKKSLRNKIQKLFRRMKTESNDVVIEFNKLIEGMKGKEISSHSDYSSLTYFIREIRDNGEFVEYYESAEKALHGLFNDIVNRKIPSEDWTMVKMNQYISDFGSESPSSANKEALSIIIGKIKDQDDFESKEALTMQGSKWYQGEIRKYLLSTLSVCSSAEKFWKLLDEYPYNKFIVADDQEFPPQLISIIRKHCEKLLMGSNDKLSDKKLIQFLPLIQVFGADKDKNCDLISWYFNQLTDNTHDVNQLLETNKLECVQNEYENFRKSTNDILKSPNVRTKIFVNSNSIKLYDFFNSMEVFSDSVHGRGVGKLADSLPFSEYISEDGTAPHDYILEDQCDIEYYGMNGEILEKETYSEINWKIQRYILKENIQEIGLLGFILSEKTPDFIAIHENREKKLMELREKSAASKRNSFNKGTSEITTTAFENIDNEDDTQESITEKLKQAIDKLKGNRVYLNILLEELKLSRKEISEEILLNALKETKDDWRIIFSGMKIDYIVAIDRIVADKSSRDKKNNLWDDEYIKWFERNPYGMIYDIKSASESIKYIIPKLLTFIKSESRNYIDAASFASQFLRVCGSNSDHRVRGMQFVAAYEWKKQNPRKGVEVNICEVIDYCELQLHRVLKMEKFQRLRDDLFATMNEEWLDKMRNKCGCKNESSRVRKERINEENRIVQKGKKDAKKKEERERAHKEKEEKYRAHKEKIRRHNDVFIKLLLNKPDSSTTNFDEFKHAVAELIKNPDYSGNRTRSMVFASCYRKKYGSVHAILSASSKYNTIFYELDDYNKKYSKNKQITADELIIFALKSIHFEENQIAGLL